VAIERGASSFHCLDGAEEEDPYWAARLEDSSWSMPDETYNSGVDRGSRGCIGRGWIPLLSENGE
jgi:hypothetical protein